MKDLILDIETTGLDASSSQLVAIGCIYNTEHIFFVNFPEEEKKVIEDFLDFLSSIPDEFRILTFYGSYYDIPFLVSRALHLGVDMMKYVKLFPIKQIDVYDIVKETLKLSKNSLADVCKFLNIEKNFIINGADMPNIYLQAVAEKDEMTKQKIKEHLRDDLKTLKNVWEKLMPVIEIEKWVK